jgi:hypothetical protein
MKRRRREKILQFSLILPDMNPSLAMIHQKLSGAVKIQGHASELENYQHLNHLIKRMDAVHS